MNGFVVEDMVITGSVDILFKIKGLKTIQVFVH